VAFLKFSRDKRGYENYYLIEPPSGGRHNVRGGKGRPRLLFWFRTPPQMKVGRTPFSDDVRKMVEAQNPGVSFDWARIVATPIPSPEADHWRERRRVEKAAKRAAREEDVEVDASADVVAAAAAEVEAAPAAADVTEVAAEPQREGAEDAGAEAQVETQAEAPVAASDLQGNPSPGHRHRRRRRRGRRGHQGSPQVPPANEV